MAGQEDIKNDIRDLRNNMVTKDTISKHEEELERLSNHYHKLDKRVSINYINSENELENLKGLTEQLGDYFEKVDENERKVEELGKACKFWKKVVVIGFAAIGLILFLNGLLAPEVIKTLFRLLF